MDFSPRPKGYNTPSGKDRFDEIAGALLKRALEVCRHLLPAGRLEGPEFKAGNLHGDRGQSLSINVREGLWKDFESGDGGHDLIALWAAVHGCKMKEALEEAERWLGVEQRREPPRPAAPIIAHSPPPADEDPEWWKRTPKTASWDYFTRDSELWGTVYRFDHPTHGKTIRPWDGQHWQAPAGTRPLYNLPAILKAPRDATIVLVEGEKCADAVNALGDPLLIATTCWGGANAAKMADWSALEGRHVLRWPDNDHPKPGKEVAREIWLRMTGELIAAARPASMRDVAFDPARPDGWDAADVEPAGRLDVIRHGLALDPVLVGAARVQLKTNTALRYKGRVIPPVEWLVEKVIPAGRAGIFAAPGGTGKGMMLLDLAAKVATPDPSGFDANPPLVFGRPVKRRGRVVILSAEDDDDEIHRRIMSMHPDLPNEVLDRIHILPYPDLSGRSPILMQGEAGDVEYTQELRDLIAELRELDDLAVIILDPLAAFAQIDMTSNAASQIVGNSIDKLAKDLGCTGIMSHHMTKGDRRHPIENASDARQAIQGGGQLLNSVRWAYGLWAPSEDHQRRVLSTLQRPFVNNAVYKGAVVKANAESDTDVATYVRSLKTGLLELIPWQQLATEQLTVDDIPTRIVEMILWAVEYFVQCSSPATVDQIAFTSGEKSKKGAGEWFALMPPPWRSEWNAKENGGKRDAIINRLVDTGRLDKKDSYLHLPGDAVGRGEFDPSFHHKGKPKPVPWPILRTVE